MPITKAIKSEDTIIIRITIQILYKESFEEFRVIPIPDEKHNIIQLYRETIAINHKLQLFFYPDKLENQIGKFKIAKNATFLKLPMQNDCISAMLTNKKNNIVCPQTRMKLPYEVFIPLESVATYLFIDQILLQYWISFAVPGQEQISPEVS